MELYRITTAGYDPDGFLGVQVQADQSHPFVEAVFPLGTVARPDDAAENEPGCTALGLDEGSGTYVLPITDPRVLPGQPKCKPGGWACFAPTKRLQTFLAFDGANGGVTLYAKDGGIAHSLNFDHNNHAVYLQQGNGAAVVLTPTEAVLRAPGSGASLSVGTAVTAFGGLTVTGSISQVGGTPVVPLAQLTTLVGQIIAVLAAHETAMGLNTPPIVPAVLSPTIATALAAVTGTTGALLK